MKNILLTFSLIILLAQSTFGNAPVVGEVFEGMVNDYDGVTMTVVDGTISSDGATVEVINITDAEIWSGNKYEFGLQTEKNGQWHWLKPRDETTANTTEAYAYTKDEPLELALNWGRRYGSLRPGHYRVSKSFFEHHVSGDDRYFELACEFTLE